MAKYHGSKNQNLDRVGLNNIFEYEHIVVNNNIHTLLITSSF
jgi:hypothetical protein